VLVEHSNGEAIERRWRRGWVGATERGERTRISVLEDAAELSDELTARQPLWRCFGR